MDKIRSLFLAANPKDTERLSLDKEIREITAKLRGSEHRDLIELISVWAVRSDDLLQSLNIYRPQIVHFSGHGSSSGEIILVDGTGMPKPVSAFALKRLFAVLKDNIRLVILNACYSKIQAEAVTESIDCAVGLTGQIGDEAAITFITSFYRAIGFGRSVQEAYDQGITALLLEGISEEYMPELIIKKGVDPSLIFLTSPLNNAFPSKPTLSSPQSNTPILTESIEPFSHVNGLIPGRSNEEQAIELLGIPSKIEEGEYGRYLEYNSRGVCVLCDFDGLVFGIYVEAPFGGRTSTGLRIGMSELKATEILEKYYYLASTAGNTRFYAKDEATKDKSDFQVWFENGRLARMKLFAPLEV